MPEEQGAAVTWTISQELYYATHKELGSQTPPSYEEMLSMNRKALALLEKLDSPKVPEA